MAEAPQGNSTIRPETQRASGRIMTRHKAEVVVTLYHAQRGAHFVLAAYGKKTPTPGAFSGPMRIKRMRGRDLAR
jgi:hypothetical protein